MNKKGAGIFILVCIIAVSIMMFTMGITQDVKKVNPDQELIPAGSCH